MRKGHFRYFLAIIPPEPLLSEISEIKQEFVEKYRSKAALRSPAHITLHMPFQWREAKEERIFKTLAKATERQPFSITLNGFGSFYPKSIFIQPEAQPKLEQLHEEILNLTKRELYLFHAVHKNGFHPHMTVAFRDLRKPLFEEAWAEFKKRPFSAAFEVNSFWLLKHNGKVWHPYREFEFKH